MIGKRCVADGGQPPSSQIVEKSRRIADGAKREKLAARGARLCISLLSNGEGRKTFELKFGIKHRCGRIATYDRFDSGSVRAARDHDDIGASERRARLTQS